MSHPAAVGRAEHRAALAAAEMLLSQRHPLLEFKGRPARGAVAGGPIEIERPDGTSESIEVRIAFGAGFPARAPVAFDAEERWEPSLDRHIPPDHSFCLYLEAVDEPNVRTSPGLESWLLDLVVFLHQQLVYDSTGRVRFPGPEWAHGRRAYAQHVIEVLGAFPAGTRPGAWAASNTGVERNGTCPCGSGRKTKRCHLDQLEEIRRVARRAELSAMTFLDLETLRDG